jgi:hypothetical protein
MAVDTSAFRPKNALKFWCRMAGIQAGTKPERFAALAIERWPELSEFCKGEAYDYPRLAKKVEEIVRHERKMRSLRRERERQARKMRDMGLI